MALSMTRSGYKASTVLASVNVMRVLILNADGNVTIQTKNYPSPSDPDGVTEEVRLYCTKCQASKHFGFAAMFDESQLIQELEWAKLHKHLDGKAIVIAQDEVETPKLESERKLKVVR
jgi:hypothetical protein